MKLDLSELEFCSKELEWINPVIEQWRNSIDLYIRSSYGKHTPHVPYAGTERANISLLAGATWQCGGVALEEFTINRGTANDPSWGRSDLWLTLNDNSLAVEAKQSWQNNNGYQDILKKMDRAVEDLGRVSSTRDDTTLGLVFVTLKVSEKVASVSRMENIIYERLSWIYRNKENLDLIAGHFPDFSDEATTKFPDTGGRTWFWPGIYMVGRLV